MPSAILFMETAVQPIVAQGPRGVKRARVLSLLVLALAGCSLGSQTGQGGPSVTTLYAATASGLSISLTGGISWTNFTAAPLNLGVNGVYAVSSGLSTAIYVATNGGLAVTQDGGTTWTNYTTTQGLGSNIVYGVFVSSPYIYAATGGGLSIYNGTAWTNITAGLGSTTVKGVFVVGSGATAAIYAATANGLSVSTDDGATWPTTYTTGLGSNTVNGVFVSGTTIYAATGGGLSIYNGTAWTNITAGLGSTTVKGVFVVGSGAAAAIYAATANGLSVSTDGGTTWPTPYTTANGLGSNTVNGVFVSGSTIYAATAGGLSYSSNAGISWTTATQPGNGLASNTVNGVFVQ